MVKGNSKQYSSQDFLKLFLLILAFFGQTEKPSQT